MPRFGCKITSGKYQGGEFPIADEGALFVGRAAEANIVLVEDMMSRLHAKLCADGDALNITDLDSTNGVFVNGVKIVSAQLRPEDEILLGTSILRVVPAAQLCDALANSETVRQALHRLGERGFDAGQSMSGDLAEFSLVDLLHLCIMNRKSGVLHIACANDYGQAQLWLHEGCLWHGYTDGLPNLSPYKVLSRLLQMTQGPFTFTSGSLPQGIPQSFTGPTEASLLEAVRLNDETKRALGKLSPADERLSMPRPMTPALRQLSAEDLDLLQLIHNVNSLQKILDAADAADSTTVHRLLKLVSKGYLCFL